MISYGANLGLMVNAATGEVHDVALRGFLRGIDGLVQPNVKGYLTNTPPGSPTDGDVYIIGTAPTGAWAGNAGKVARWYANGGSWDFYTPKNGWMLQSNSAREAYRYTGGAWEIYYQEGTFTPTLTGGTTPGSPTYGTQTGIFQVSGAIVHCSVYVQTTSLGGMSGNVYMSSFPFTARSGSQGNGTFGYVDGVTFPGAPTLVMDQNTTRGAIFGFVSGGPSAQLNVSNIAASTYLIGAITYER